MIEMVSTQLGEGDTRSQILLNIALSEKTGHLMFADPGNEGGKLIGNAFSDLPQMTRDDFVKHGQCKYSLGEFRNMTVDDNRKTTVPTYTLDLLVTSLEGLSKIKRGEEIFVVKIDTEGHDYSVLLGAKDLLHNKRITFVIFEVWSNHFVKLVARHMAHYGYQCFLLTRYTLVPVHETDWWYVHMGSFKRQWWGNGLCG
ncbi:hypothetical protein ACHAW6_000165, partial [Cyclotella cf. meneghiniana]